MKRGIVLLALLLALAGCGDFPRPFQGNPGATARMLAQPPPTRLVVPMPATALLGDEGAKLYAKALVTALVAQDVPAMVAPEHGGDWRLEVSAALAAGMVTPDFAIEDPHGARKGSIQGAPVNAADWANGDPKILTQSAIAAAPRIASLLTSIEAIRQRADPNSLLNRPARIFMGNVTGAPGDGNLALGIQMRAQLPQTGLILQDQAAGADFTLNCQVRTAPGLAGTERVEIQWIVLDNQRQGREAGRIAQINEVPPESIATHWGEVALVVASQAAAGVKQVVDNSIGGRKEAAPASAPAAAAKAVP